MERLEPLNVRMARVIMEWKIEEFPDNGSIYAYDDKGKRIRLEVPFYLITLKTWSPLHNNDDMDQVIEQMRHLGFNFRLEYNRKDKYYKEDHIYAVFLGEKYAFSGTAKEKLTAITKALTDFMDFKEALQNETKHTEVGSN